MVERFLRVDDTTQVTGLPVSTIRDMVAKNKFPKPVHISPRLIAWRESEVAEWQAARIAERDGRAVA